jgi:hypothetical protein
MMNGDLVREESQHLASRVLAQAGKDDRTAQIAKAFELALQRPTKQAEVEMFLKYPGPLASICRVLLESNEFLYVD